MIIKKLFRALINIFVYIYANLIIAFHYNRKYIRGRFFSEGKHLKDRISAIGWKWVIADYRSCKQQGVNRKCPFPVSARNLVFNPENIIFDSDDLNMFQDHGKYFQARGKIYIGKGTYIAPNVGIITSNHMLDDLNLHSDPKDVVIGQNCWIGMNSMILPGVKLGNKTIVGAGAVVTKSFPDGNCVIGGNPAKIIRLLKIGE